MGARAQPGIPLTSSKIRFLARVIAELRALIQDSFSSGLTARKIRFGAYKRGNSGQCWNSHRGQCEACSLYRKGKAELNFQSCLPHTANPRTIYTPGIPQDYPHPCPALEPVSLGLAASGQAPCTVFPGCLEWARVNLLWFFLLLLLDFRSSSHFS